mgnify:CR=1 FL=1
MVHERDGMRASDADRAAVAERLRVALEEGRLDLGEYDDRLQRVYASKTYGELDLLVADLPAPAPSDRSQLVPYRPADVSEPGAGEAEPAPARYPHATRRWLAEIWGGYLSVTAIVVGVWGVVCVMTGELMYFWPGWVAGPWGVVMLASTVGGLTSGEPQRWAAKKARKAQARREKRSRQGGRYSDNG